MAGLIYNLIEVLNEQTGIYEEIVALSTQKKELLIQGDMEELTKLIKTLEDVAINAKSLERKRTEILNDMAQVLNKNKDTITVTEILECVKEEPDQYEGLNEAKQKLVKVMASLKKINSENMALVNQSLEYVEYSMNVLQSTLSVQPPSYTPDGDSGGNYTGGRSMFDAKQ